MKKYAALFVFCFFFASCTTVQVQSKFNRDVDFSQFESYAWLLDKDEPSSDVRVDNPLVRTSVRSSVEDVLSKKGFLKVDRDDADVLVTWVGAIDKKIKTEDIEHFYNPYGYGALFREPQATNQQDVKTGQEYEEGTLMVAFVDPVSKKLLWHGTGKAEVKKGGDEKKVKSYIDESINNILKKFPPNSK